MVQAALLLAGKRWANGESLVNDPINVFPAYINVDAMTWNLVDGRKQFNTYEHFMTAAQERTLAEQMKNISAHAANLV